MRPPIVPVQLGCCLESPRCLLCNPPPPEPSAEKIQGLLAHYGAPEQPVEVRFFGGPPPSQAMVEAVGGLPFSVRVRPDCLSRAQAAQLITSGCEGFELDALSFDDLAVKGAGRHHRRALVLEQLAGLRSQGMRVGVVLAVGLPGTSLATCLADAHTALGCVDTVRLHPVLVLEHSGLREAHMDGRFQPLSLGDCVTACRAMMDVLEPGGVEVIRVGQQPGPDELGGRSVAGPAHSSLRELIEARRALELLKTLCADLPVGARVSIRCAPADVARVRGPLNQHMRTLRADHALDEVHVRPDPALPRGRYEVEVA